MKSTRNVSEELNASSAVSQFEVDHFDCSSPHDDIGNSILITWNKLRLIRRTVFQLRLVSVLPVKFSRITGSCSDVSSAGFTKGE